MYNNNKPLIYIIQQNTSLKFFPVFATVINSINTLANVRHYIRYKD